MSMGIALYNFSKPRNSTKVPTWDNNGVWKTEAILKEPTSIDSPVLKFSHMLQGIPMDNAGKMYNYAYIDPFKRYYFIEKWSANPGGIWEAHLTVDPLASFKSRILASSQYVLRCEQGSRFTDYLTDTMYPIINKTQVVSSEYNLLGEGGAWTNNLTEGCFVLSIISPSPADSFGSSTLYCFTPQQMADFCDYLYGSTDWLNLDASEISDSLGRMLFNPIQYITSAMYYPFNAGWFDGRAVNEINLGWWKIGKNAKVLTERVLLGGTVPLSIPKHPQSGLGKYMNCEPYTSYTFYFPGVGSFPIDSRMLVDVNEVLFGFDIDIATGEARVMVYGTGGLLENVACASGKIAVQIELAQIRSNEAGIMAGVAKAVSNKVFNAFPALDVGGKISNVVNGVASSVETANSSTTHIGATGTLLGLVYNPHIKAVFRERTDPDFERFGKPCCSEYVLENLSGYVKTLDAKFAYIPEAMPAEVDAICSYLDGGVFIE